MKPTAEPQDLAARFEENRVRLRAVAYRMLGSHSEADDAVQEAWLRLNRADSAEVENLGGWLTTVVARVCLDVLRSREAAARGSAGAATISTRRAPTPTGFRPTRRCSSPTRSVPR